MTLLHSCTQYSSLSNRNQPTVHDMIDTFEGLGLSLTELGAFSETVRRHEEGAKRYHIQVGRPKRGHENWENPSASFLPSDDQNETDNNNASSSTWATLMHDIVPDHLPPEPPRHCWMFTPVYATEVLSDMPALQLVNRKLDNARLVESSLRKLIKHTDSATPLKPWVSQQAPKLTEDGVLSSQKACAMNDADQSSMSVDEPMTVSELESSSREPLTTESMRHWGNKERHDSARHALPRAVNYKAAWYASFTSTDSKLPTSNLYTARLRGNMDESSRRPRRFVVPS